uniref:Secreted protein n=1 Tax=Sparus aurata TaxID=8175 RepID=A0A671YWD2_SPAAU
MTVHLLTVYLVTVHLLTLHLSACSSPLEPPLSHDPALPVKHCGTSCSGFGSLPVCSATHPAVP